MDVNTLDHLAARTLALNEVGYANFSLAQSLAFDPLFRDNRDTGGFILIDRFSNATGGAWDDRFRLAPCHQCPLAGSGCGTKSGSARDPESDRRPWCCRFTGLSRLGKSTIANLVEKSLTAEGKHTYLLDGDNVRHGLNKDLGFTDADRVENIRRVGEASKLFVDAGLIVLVSFISPFRSERRMARDLLGQDEFIEVFVGHADRDLHRP